MDVRVVAAVILLSLAVASAGCGHAETTSQRDRADAKAFVAAGRQFTRATPALIRAAEKRTARTFYECSLVRLGSPDVPPLTELAGISFVAYYQALLPAYRQLALRLRSIRARDSTLRGVAGAAVDLSRRYGRLGTARPDYCHALRAWQAAGWRKNFALLRAIGVRGHAFDATGAPRNTNLRRSEQEIAASGERMRELGVGEDDVVAFLLAADAFAAGRGGYSEIELLSRE